jgi:hypothetical protein
MTPLCPIRRARSTLVGLEGARAALGCDGPSLLRLAECGRLRWVFDVSAASPARPRHLRAWRFWTCELAGPEGQKLRRLAPAEAVARIIGTRSPWLGTTRVGDTLGVSWCTVARLLQTGALKGRRAGWLRSVRRESLARFLQARLVQ